MKSRQSGRYFADDIFERIEGILLYFDSTFVEVCP